MKVVRKVVGVLLLKRRGARLTTTQLHVWSLLIGAVVGTAITGYQYALQALVDAVWHKLVDAIVRTGVFGPQFPLYNINWMIPVTLGGLVGGVMLSVCRRLSLQTGTIVHAIQGVHDPGHIDIKLLLPMLLVSLVTITAGGSAGPEAAVIVMGGALMSLLGHTFLQQPMRERRIITLCGMGASLASFFGMPLPSALFVLEIPHANGLEFYEATSPVVCSAIVAAIFNKMITGRHLGGSFEYPPIPHDLYFSSLGWAAVLGLLAGVTALCFIALVKSAKWLVEAIRLNEWPFVQSLIASMLVGFCGVMSPSSLFWSENELQWALSLGANTTALPCAQSPGVIQLDSPLLAWQLFVSGFFKMLAIAFTLAGGWPGGIIFPLIFMGALFGNGWGRLIGLNATIASATFMASMKASVLRTPWAAVLIITLLQSGFTEPTAFLQILPLLVISVTMAMVSVYWFRFYGHEQHGRRDVKHVDPKIGLILNLDDESDEDDEEKAKPSEERALLTHRSDDLCVNSTSSGQL